MSYARAMSCHLPARSSLACLKRIPLHKISLTTFHPIPVDLIPLLVLEYFVSQLGVKASWGLTWHTRSSSSLPKAVRSFKWSLLEVFLMSQSSTRCSLHDSGQSIVHTSGIVAWDLGASSFGANRRPEPSQLSRLESLWSWNT